jgi:transcriptional regulator with XRE-family HTH domain
MDKSVHSPEYQCFLRELRRAREATGLTQAEIAQRLGEPQSWVSRVESGETRMHLIEFRAYCQAIGISPVDFIANLEGALQSLPSAVSDEAVGNDDIPVV